MNIKEILDLKYHKVYYIKNDEINFYLSIPKTVETTNITIEIKSKMSNFNLELNDEIWVMDNIKTTFSYIDNYNITLAIPIFNDNEVDILEKINIENYSQIDKIMANVINTAYKTLLQENKKVSSQIVIINNDRYKTFITWFTTKYKNRVICKTLLELIQIFNINATSYKKLETPLMNFVVGNYNTEVNAPKITHNNEEEKKIVLVQPKRQLQTSSGFASYWILIIIIVIVLAVIGYIVFI